jgi:hypothetical protein
VDGVVSEIEKKRALVFRLPSGNGDMAKRIVESLITLRDGDIPLLSDRVMMADSESEVVTVA